MPRYFYILVRISTFWEGEHGPGEEIFWIFSRQQPPARLELNFFVKYTYHGKYKTPNWIRPVVGWKKGVDFRSKIFMSNYNTSNSISSFSTFSDINAHNVENVTSNKLGSKLNLNVRTFECE